MFILVIAFPLYYKYREPELRRDAKASQEQQYRVIGSELFETNCSGCHGKNGTGGSAPTLNSKQFLSTTTDGQINLLVSGGVSGTDMSAWSQDFGGSLTAEQIRQVTTFLRSLEPTAPDVPDWRSGTKATS